MLIFIYACEQEYGGYHGIEDFRVEEFDRGDFSDEDELDRYIWDEWISEMSWNLLESYGYLFSDFPEDDEDFVDGYWCFIKSDVTLSLEELNNEAVRLGPTLFKDKYCEVK